MPLSLHGSFVYLELDRIFRSAGTVSMRIEWHPGCVSVVGSSCWMDYSHLIVFTVRGWFANPQSPLKPSGSLVRARALPDKTKAEHDMPPPPLACASGLTSSIRAGGAGKHNLHTTTKGSSPSAATWIRGGA